MIAVEESQRIERIARRFASRWLQGYARGKLRSDPIYRTAFDRLRGSRWPILDIGCGIGLLGFYLRERGLENPVLGLDLDRKKIAAGRRVAGEFYHGRGIELMEGDGAAEREFAGNVVIFDVLHYWSAAAQRAVLERAARQIAPGGVCLIRTTPRSNHWRFKVTVLEEFFLQLTRWMKSPPVCFPEMESVAAPFVERGMATETGPLWGNTPFNSHLLVATRAG